ncbi:MAG TPA: hypothetical protein PLL15_05830 [Syntrophales bacterium]|jgi:hypothetical protein|nr:hypothetical protein [Syntrophales bacterium]
MNPEWKFCGKHERVGCEIGALVDRKNAAYGDSFAKAGAFLSLIYPHGIAPDQYPDALGLVRVFDKMMRIATNRDRDPFGEDPWEDIAGYAILMSTQRRDLKGGVNADSG